MPKIASISTYKPPYTIKQSNMEKFARELFQQKLPQLERLLTVFDNGDIDQRHFSVPIEWHQTPRSFEERNTLYTQFAATFSAKAIEACLGNENFLTTPISTADIDLLIFVSSTGISTPSIDARVMNLLPFSDRLKRLPIWGLGCGGGVAGLSRAFDYCKAHPHAKVLVVCTELCSLTFQTTDFTKSNLIGTSLFADGVACALVIGDDVIHSVKKPLPTIINTASKWMPNSENVMGWELKDNGLHVVFSKNIPAIITKWLGPFIHTFLDEAELSMEQIQHFIAHPGGKKVLQAYETTLGIPSEMTALSRNTLRNNGNMSSPTVLYVLEEFMLQDCAAGDFGLAVALGPGFSGEVALLQWRD